MKLEMRDGTEYLYLETMFCLSITIVFAISNGRLKNQTFPPFVSMCRLLPRMHILDKYVALTLIPVLAKQAQLSPNYDLLASWQETYTLFRSFVTPDRLSPPPMDTDTTSRCITGESFDYAQDLITICFWWVVSALPALEYFSGVNYIIGTFGSLAKPLMRMKVKAG